MLVIVPLVIGQGTDSKPVRRGGTQNRHGNNGTGSAAPDVDNCRGLTRLPSDFAFRRLDSALVPHHILMPSGIDCGDPACSAAGTERNYDHNCCGGLVSCVERRPVLLPAPLNCDEDCDAFMEVCRPACATSGATHIGPWVATFGLSVVAQLI